MKLNIQIARVVLLLCGAVAFLARPALCQSSCKDFACPAGYVCACEDCGVCNSGSFIVICACKPVPGKVICSVTNGDCSATTACNRCCSTSSGGTHCTYTGCTGQLCPPNTSPVLGALNAWLLPASVSYSDREAAACADPSPQLLAQACRNCESRAVDLGPEANGEVAQLLIPKDIPVDFQAVRLNFRNGGVLGGSYTLRNNSRSGLVTLVTLWTFQGSDPKSPGTTATDVIDSWVTDSAFLGPGDEKEEELNMGVLANGSLSVHRVAGTVVYAEFEDGTKVGPGVSSFGPRLRSERQKVLRAYKDLLDKIQSGASNDEVGQYMQTRDEFRWLISMRGQNGLDWLVAEITKTRHLTP